VEVVGERVRPEQDPAARGRPVRVRRRRDAVRPPLLEGLRGELRHRAVLEPGERGDGARRQPA